MNRKRLRARVRNSNNSYVARRWQKKSRKRVYLTIAILVILIYSFFTWFLPAMIGGLSFVNQIKPAPTPQANTADNITLAPPVLNIPFEATNSSTIKIKGYASPNLTVKVYVDDELKSTTQTSEKGDFTSEEISLNLGTNNIYGKTSDSKDNTSLPSQTLRLIYNNEKPQLTVDSPTDNQVITGGDKKVTVSGKASSKDNVTVSINGQIVILKEDGSYFHTLDINEGENSIVIVAKDRVGNSTQISRQVTYNNS